MPEWPKRADIDITGGNLHNVSAGRPPGPGDRREIYRRIIAYFDVLTGLACGNEAEGILRNILLNGRAKAGIAGEYLSGYGKADAFANSVLQSGTRKNRPGDIDREEQQTQHRQKSHTEFDEGGARFGANESAKGTGDGHGDIRNSGSDKSKQRPPVGDGDRYVSSIGAI